MRTTTNHSRLFCLAGRQAHYERGRPPLPLTTSSNHSLLSFVALCVGDEKLKRDPHQNFPLFCAIGWCFFSVVPGKRNFSQVREIPFLSAKNPFLFLTADFDPSHPHPPLLVSPRLPSPLWHHHHLLGSWLGQSLDFLPPSIILPTPPNQSLSQSGREEKGESSLTLLLRLFLLLLLLLLLE